MKTSLEITLRAGLCNRLKNKTLSTLTIGLFLVGFANASLIGVDDFESYSTGGLDGLNGGNGWSGGWTADNSVLGVVNPTVELNGDRSLRFTGSDNNAAYRQLSEGFGDDSGEDELYVSMLFRLDAGVPINNMFAVMWVDNAASGSHNNAPNVGLKMDGDGSNDLMARLSLNDDVLYVEDIGSPPTSTYMLVARYFKDTDQASETYNQFTGVEFWVNPTQADENSPDTIGEYAGTFESFNYVGFRTANVGNGAEILVDDIVIGTTFDDVIPEPVTVSLVVLFGISTLSIRRIFG